MTENQDGVTQPVTGQKLKKQMDNLRSRGVPGITVPHQVAYLLDKYPHFTVSDMSYVLGRSKQSIYTSKHTVMKARRDNPDAYTYNRKDEDWRIRKALNDGMTDHTSSAQGPVRLAQPDVSLYPHRELEITDGIELTDDDRRGPDIWDEQDLPFELPDPPPMRNGAVSDLPIAPKIQAVAFQAEPIVIKESIIDLHMRTMDGRALKAVMNALCAQLQDDAIYHVHFVVDDE